MIVVVSDLAFDAGADFAVTWHRSAVVSAQLVVATQVAVVVGTGLVQREPSQRLLVLGRTHVGSASRKFCTVPVGSSQTQGMSDFSRGESSRLPC